MLPFWVNLESQSGEKNHTSEILAESELVLRTDPGAKLSV
jgi:hypothetical protein